MKGGRTWTPLVLAAGFAAACQGGPEPSEQERQVIARCNEYISEPPDTPFTFDSSHTDATGQRRIVLRHKMSGQAVLTEVAPDFAAPNFGITELAHCLLAVTK